MRRVVIINQACGNRGDEAAHRAFVKALLEDGRFEVTTLTVGVAEGALSSMRVPGAGYVNLSPGRLYYKLTAGALKKRLGFLWRLSGTARRIAREMKGADAVVCAPGGMDLGGFRNWHHLFLVRLALLTAPEVAYFGRSIGPFGHDRFAAMSIGALRRCGFVSLRDARSWDVGDASGLQAHKMLDVVFAARRPSVSDIAPGSGLPEGIGRAEYCVLVPNSLQWHPAFSGLGADCVKSFFISMIHGIAERFPGLKIILLPQLFGERGVNQGDADFFKELAAASGQGDGSGGIVHALPGSIDSDMQRAIVSGARFLAGARYHSAVFAASAGTPLLSLTYEDKMKGLVERLPLPSVAEYDLRCGLDASAALSRLDGMSLSRYETSPELEAVRDLTGKCLAECLEWLAEG